jgi:hypothetical protein
MCINSVTRSVYMKPDAFRSLSLLPYLHSMNLHSSIIVRIQSASLTFFRDLWAVQDVEGGEAADLGDRLQVREVQILRIYQHD